MSSRQCQLDEVVEGPPPDRVTRILEQLVVHLCPRFGQILVAQRFQECIPGGSRSPGQRRYWNQYPVRPRKAHRQSEVPKSAPTFRESGNVCWCQRTFARSVYFGLNFKAVFDSVSDANDVWVAGMVYLHYAMIQP